MPEFILNADTGPGTYKPRQRKHHPFYDLDTFARCYVEAMFFTNGDTGDERENLLNDWGVEKLTRASVEEIRKACEAFKRDNARLLDLAYSTDDYDDAQAGRDFWFTRQGHGVGFWDRKPLDFRIPISADSPPVLSAKTLGEYLADKAREVGECYVEAYRGWIHVR